MKDGVGEPVAEHRRETGGPGRNACSINVYCSSGTVSKNSFSKIRFFKQERNSSFRRREIYVGKAREGYIYPIIERKVYTYTYTYTYMHTEKNVLIMPTRGIW